MTTADVSILTDLTQSQTLTLNQDQLTVSLSANSVLGGGANATVSLTYGDPSSSRGRAIFPGDYSATNAIDSNADILLESIGFMDITVTDENGTDLSHLTEPAEVTLRLPAIYQIGGVKDGDINIGDTIEWWSYNEEQGIWLREDADPSTEAMDNALITDVGGVLFANAKVTHFSWWNVDQPIEEHACITVKVIDDDEKPVANISVTAEGVSVSSSTTVLTNAEGFASVTIKRTADLGAPETFRLYADIGTASFFYDVTSVLEGEVDTDILNSPSQFGSTYPVNSGECVLLGNSVQLLYLGTINGVLRNSDGAVAENITLYNSLGDSTVTDSEGRFSFSVPFSEISVFIPDLFSEQYSTSEETPIIEIEIVLSNQTPVVHEILVEPSSGILPGQTIQLTVDATDAEGDALIYAWNASEGALSNDSGEAVSWTAPSDDSGTADLSVTVKDTENNEVSSSKMISWQKVIEESDFFVQVKPSFFLQGVSGEVEGLTVILHGIDGESIEKVVLTNADGIANFGSLDRNRVTITIIEEYQENELIRYNASSYINMLAVPIPYWSKSNSIDGFISCLFDGGTFDIQAKFINIPDDVESIYVSPTFNESFTPIENEVVTVSVCNYLIDLDGFVVSNFVANGYDGEDITTASVVAHSQQISIQSEEEILVFDMSQRPVIMPYINNTGTPLDLFVTPHDNFYEPLVVDTDSVNSELLLYDFPQESYAFFASTESSSFVDDLGVGPEGFYVLYNSLRLEDQLPVNLVIDAPEYTADEIEIDNVAGIISWSLSNSESVDTIVLHQKYLNADWDITLSPLETSLKLPQLPEMMSGIINRNNLSAQEIELSDLNNYQGYDAIIELLNTALDLEDGKFLSISLGRDEVTYKAKEID